MHPIITPPPQPLACIEVNSIYYDVFVEKSQGSAALERVGAE